MFKKRDKAKSKELIIKSAIAVFAKYGYERATYKNISEAAGLNESLITRYFGSKKGLLAAAMDFIRQEFYTILNIAEQKPTFKEELHYAGDLLVDMYKKNVNNFLIFFMLVPDKKDESKEVFLLSKEKREFVFRYNDNRLKQFQEKGEIPAGIDLEQLYNRLVILLHSTIYFAFIALKLPMNEVEELLHYHIDIFIKGLNCTNN